MVGNGGFEEVELERGYYRITFKGNDATSKERASDFALLRASELMKNNQCNAFKVVRASDEVRTGGLLLPQTQTTNVSLSSFGNTTTGNSTSTRYGGGVATLYFPKTTLEVKCVTENPDVEKGIYETDFINSSLKSKYKIK